MIKKYNQFVKERINEEFDNEAIEQELGEVQDNIEDAESELNAAESELDEIQNEVDYDEEEQMEEEGGDIYAAKLQEVADKLGCEVTDSKVMCNGKKIIFPSETEMYHVDNKKFKTSDEVVDYINGSKGPSQPSQDEMSEMERVPHNKLRQMSDFEADREADEMDEDERYAAMEESKSYKHTRKFK